MRKPLIVLALLCFLPAVASEPGQPLDCSDWVFVEPGYSCSPEIGLGEDLWGSGVNAQVDNEGRIVRTRREMSGECGTDHLWRYSAIYYEGGQWHTLGYVEDRCNSESSPPSIGYVQSGGSLPVLFNRVDGKLFVSMSVACAGDDCSYSAEGQILAIEGFTTTIEILQTYEPTSGPISFRVPHMPEGFQHADHFDTYYGDLATVGDWSQAQPLQCGYPATAPGRGDYLTVADTLPALKPGEARCYVTAVTHQGETRYGRKSSGGVLTGRDPALLPACE